MSSAVPIADVQSSDEMRDSANDKAAEEFRSDPVPLVDPTQFPPTPEGLASFLSEIDGPRPVNEGTAHDTDVASFRASDVVVAAGTTLEVPIPVWTRGSEVTVLKAEVDDSTEEGNDVGFGVFLTSSDNGDVKMSMVRNPEQRITSLKDPLKFKVKVVPTSVMLKFDNYSSWITNKNISYLVEVTPPIDAETRARSKRAGRSLQSISREIITAEDGIKKIEQVWSAAKAEVEKAEEKVTRSSEALAKKSDEIKKRLESVRMSESALHDLVAATTKSELDILQLEEEQDECQERIKEIKIQLMAAESEFEAKSQQIQSQHEHIRRSKDQATKIDADIAFQLKAVEESGHIIKELKNAEQEYESTRVEAKNELQSIEDAQAQAQGVVDFYRSVFRSLQPRMLDPTR